MPDLFAALAAEFPRDAVHWRAQSVTKEGDKALALAYIDARDVMDRLDEACGPAGWRNTVVETPKGRLIATIEIKIDGEWVGKTDGAGETDVEGDKGGISDALKRAAVLWGVGRYLYRLSSPWVPCQCSEWNGKKQWKRWTDDPWNHVRGVPAPARAQKLAPAPRAAPKPAAAADPASVLDEIETIATQFPGKSASFHMLVQQLRACQTTQAYKSWEDKNLAVIGKLDGDEVALMRAEADAQKKAIRNMNQLAA